MGDLRTKVFFKFKGRCAYCGEYIALQDFNVDHLIPKQKGGSNDIDNLMPSCRSCNSWKAAWTLEEFRDVIERQQKTLTKNSAGYRLLVRYKMVRELGDPVEFFFESDVKRG